MTMTRTSLFGCGEIALFICNTNSTSSLCMTDISRVNCVYQLLDVSSVPCPSRSIVIAMNCFSNYHIDISACLRSPFHYLYQTHHYPYKWTPG